MKTYSYLLICHYEVRCDSAVLVCMVCWQVHVCDDGGGERRRRAREKEPPLSPFQLISQPFIHLVITPLCVCVCVCVCVELCHSDAGNKRKTPQFAASTSHTHTHTCSHIHTFSLSGSFFFFFSTLLSLILSYGLHWFDWFRATHTLPNVTHTHTHTQNPWENYIYIYQINVHI